MTDPSTTTRRAFLTTSTGGLSAGWLLLNLPLLSSLAGCARDAAGRDDPLRALSPEEGRTLKAFVARLIPSDDGTPGATEAGAAHFVDAAIDGPFGAMAEPVRAGLAELESRAAQAHGAAFADLSAAHQDEVIGGFEGSESGLFFPLRLLTVMGVMGDPSRGGNRDYAGWAILGRDHAGAYQPPFGHYDAEAMDAEGALEGP